MTLHMVDLQDAKQYLEAYSPDNSSAVNRALVYGAIVSYYKCFGCNDCRPHSLLRDKVLAHEPPEAKEFFDYYQNLRNKYIAHDGSNCSIAAIGVILDPDKGCPLVDVVSTAFLSDHANGDTSTQGAALFLKLISVTMDWVERKIDGLCIAIKNLYGDKPMSYFQECKPIQIQIPTHDQMFDLR